jgi:hypothetical protein
MTLILRIILLLYNSRDNCCELVINNVEEESVLATIVKSNIENTKDERLEFVDISKGLIEMLQNAGFTIESILDNEPSHIAETLGIDGYVCEIIYNETKKRAATSSNINSNF